jgi:hypothetical protein
MKIFVYYIFVFQQQMIEKLDEMIDSEEWLVDYTIKRVIDKIYLQWI